MLSHQWPGRGDAMVGLINRSIDLLEQPTGESGNVFGLNRRGYVYAACDRQGAAPSSAGIFRGSRGASRLFFWVVA